MTYVLLTIQFLNKSTTNNQEHTLPNKSVTTLYQISITNNIMYSTLFTTYNTLIHHPIILELEYTFTIKTFLNNLPKKNQTLTIQYYLHNYLYNQSNTILTHIKQLNNGHSVNLINPHDTLLTLIYILMFALIINY